MDNPKRLKMETLRHQTDSKQWRLTLELDCPETCWEKVTNRIYNEVFLRHFLKNNFKFIIILIAMVLFQVACLSVYLRSRHILNVSVKLDINGANVENLSGHKTPSMFDIPVARGDYLVPNLVHFVIFGDQNGSGFLFLNYLSILSAYKVQKPEMILLHCDIIPNGTWWERVWKEVPLKIIYRAPPLYVHGQKLAHVFHQADVAKLEILQEYGGIYMDYDVIIINSLDPLRMYPMTLGKEKNPKLIAGIMIAERDALFLRIVHASYKKNYHAKKWDYNCAEMAYALYLKRPELVHIEPRKLTTPDWRDRELLYKDTINWRELYVLHFMFHASPRDTITLETIKTMKGIMGSVLRYTYYGDPKVISS